MQYNLANIKRDIYDRMTEWKRNLITFKTTLEVEGPRQVGKTFIVKEFVKNNFKTWYYLDLQIEEIIIPYLEPIEQNALDTLKGLDKF